MAATVFSASAHFKEITKSLTANLPRPGNFP